MIDIAGVVASTTQCFSQCNYPNQQWQTTYSGGNQQALALEPGLPNTDYRPVEAPDRISLLWGIVDGVKAYRSITEEVMREFASGLKSKMLGI